MKTRTMWLNFSTAVLLLTFFAIAPQLHALPAIKQNTPGSQFSPEGRPENVRVDDVSGGRRFRGKAHATVFVRAVIKLPQSNSAELKMERLVVHFRTSQGPSLRSVEIREGSPVIKLATNITGDYTTRETSKPDSLANAWDWGKTPVKVSAQTVIRLEILFSGGIDGGADAGEFILTGVEVDFRHKDLTAQPTVKKDSAIAAASVAQFSMPTIKPAAAPLIQASSKGVLYVVGLNNELTWYRHDGRGNGTFTWAAPEGKKVGQGWDFKQVFSGGDGVIYAITTDGDLMWYRHDGRDVGSFTWAAPEGKKVGQGWNFKQVFAGDNGVIYAITEEGDLMWYRHEGRGDGSFTWSAPQGKKVGQGWNFKQVFSGSDGVIYAVKDDGDLMWYRHDGRTEGSTAWTAPEGKKIGEGWNFKQVFSGGDGIIYAVTAEGDLLWYRHDGRDVGSPRWAAPAGKKVGNGWVAKEIFSSEN